MLDHWYTGENTRLKVLILEIDRTLKKALELAELVQQKSSGDAALQQTANQAIRETLQELLQQDKQEQFTIQDLLQQALEIDSPSPIVRLLSKAHAQLETVKEKMIAFKQQLNLEEASDAPQKIQEQQLLLTVEIRDHLTRVADELKHELFVELNYYNPGLQCPQCKKHYVTTREKTIGSSTKMYTYTCHNCPHTEIANDKFLPRVRDRWVVSAQLV